MPDITSVSFTFHDERKREEYGPMKKAEATITAAVPSGEDGAVILANIKFIAISQVRAALTIDGGVSAQAAAPAPPAAEPSPAPGVADKGSPDIAGEVAAAPAPQPVIRRTQDEINRGLSVDQARAERAAKAAATAAPEAPIFEEPAQEPISENVAEEWDQPVTAVQISDVELSSACSEAAARLGEGGGAKVRDVKERFNPAPGQPFTVRQIPADKRKLFLDQVAAL